MLAKPVTQGMHVKFQMSRKKHCSICIVKRLQTFTFACLPGETSSLSEVGLNPSAVSLLTYTPFLFVNRERVAEIEEASRGLLALCCEVDVQNPLQAQNFDSLKLRKSDCWQPRKLSFVRLTGRLYRKQVVDEP